MYINPIYFYNTNSSMKISEIQYNFIQLAKYYAYNNIQKLLCRKTVSKSFVIIKTLLSNKKKYILKDTFKLSFLDGVDYAQNSFYNFVAYLNL